jgi:uncharacterized protein YicC (UPF0701 family)
MVNASLVSMTGFAARRGHAPGHDWGWEIRSVNGKGLDLRLKLPDWINRRFAPRWRRSRSAATSRSG